MPIPMAVGALGVAAVKRAIAAKSCKKSGKAPPGGRRRRRARLTQSEMLELANIKNILGRTAAANALPYYLGRGR